MDARAFSVSVNVNGAAPGSSAILLLHLVTFQSHAWSCDHIAHHGALKPRSPPAHTEPASPKPKINETTTTTQAYSFFNFFFLITVQSNKTDGNEWNEFATYYCLNI